MTEKKRSPHKNRKIILNIGKQFCTVKTQTDLIHKMHIHPTNLQFTE